MRITSPRIVAGPRWWCKPSPALCNADTPTTLTPSTGLDASCSSIHRATHGIARAMYKCPLRGWGIATSPGTKTGKARNDRPAVSA